MTVPSSSVHDLLRNRLRMFRYKLQVVQQLEARDYTARIRFASWCSQNFQADASFLDRVICSGERMFHVHGKVSKHSIGIWRAENPHK